MESFPEILMKAVPADEVCMVIPQGFNNSYRDMSLRARKKAQLEGIARKVAVDDVSFLLESQVSLIISFRKHDFL